jgi:ribonuclease D
MILNSLICKLINVQANRKDNNEKKILDEDEISKLIKAFPKDIAALDKRSVLAKVNSQGSGT